MKKGSTKTKISHDQEKIVAQYVYKYLDFNNVKALSELKKIDLFKNNYLDKTIDSYILGLRTYVTTGYKNRGIPKFLVRETDELIKKHYPKLTPSAKDRYVGKNSRVMPTENVKLETPSISSNLPQVSTQFTETSQKISAIKSKLDLELKSLDAEADKYRVLLDGIENKKQKAKAKILDKVLELFN